MFAENLMPNDGNIPTVSEILNLTHYIRKDGTKAKRLYTYAILEGTIKSGRHRPDAIFIVSTFHDYAAESATRPDVSKAYMSKIKREITDIDLTGETLFKPNTNKDAELNTFQLKTNMPDIILEYGKTKFDDGLIEPYIVLHHGKDRSTDRALKLIQAALSRYGRIG